MNDWRPFLPFPFLAFICALASVLIACVAFLILGPNGGHISDNGMYGIAAMAAAPAVMGIGIAGYMPRDRQ
jgi:phosphotransferase system  glucose/maltose/N-acetylglucosamine-specific IIC component